MKMKSGNFGNFKSWLMKVFFGLSLMKTNQAQKVELLDRNMQNLETLSIEDAL